MCDINETTDISGITEIPTSSIEKTPDTKLRVKGECPIYLACTQFETDSNLPSNIVAVDVLKDEMPAAFTEKEDTLAIIAKAIKAISKERGIKKIKGKYQVCVAETTYDAIPEQTRLDFEALKIEFIISINMPWLIKYMTDQYVITGLKKEIGSMHEKFVKISRVLNDEEESVEPPEVEPEEKSNDTDGIDEKETD